MSGRCRVRSPLQYGMRLGSMNGGYGGANFFIGCANNFALRVGDRRYVIARRL